MRDLLRLAVASIAFAAIAASPTLGSQATILQPVSGPHSMADLEANYLNPALTAILTNNSGSTAPTNGPSSAPFVYQWWADTSTSPPTLRMWDGTTGVQAHQLTAQLRF